MNIWNRLKRWLDSRRPQELDELLAVEFDDNEVRVRVLEKLEPDWNQTFRWSRVKRVCFKDGGLMASDNVFVEVHGGEKRIVVPTEAKGGSSFFGELCERGLLPEEIWRKAVGDTAGGMRCWPPHEVQD